MAKNERGGSQWNIGLEGPAFAIAATDAHPLRVSAGPGTGKTFALMRRVARLLGDGANPRRILTVTFTRTAARDLIKNLRTLDVPGCEKVRASTLHSYCFSVLSKGGVLETTGRVPRPLMKFETRVLFEDLVRPERGVRECKRLADAFEADWARLQSDTPGWPADAEARAFHHDLMSWLRFHEAMLLGELVNEMRRYLRDNPLCEERTAFDHVLVDEYQDLNRADQDLIDLLAENASLTVIGDENQAIYTRLRYSHPESIRDFHVARPDTTDIPLLECRRCPPNLVQIANSLISRNRNREPRELIPQSGRPDANVMILQWPTIEDEASGIAEMIDKAIRSEEVAPQDVLVLAPRRRTGYSIRDGLLALGQDAHSYFSEEALDTPKAQERFTLLTLAARPDDRAAFRCWMGFESHDFASRPYARVRQACESENSAPREVVERIYAGNLAIPYTKGIATRYEKLNAELRALDGLTGHDLIDALFPAADAEAASVRLLACAAAEELGDEMDVKALLPELTSKIVQPEIPTGGNFVRVMSLHKSKGLTAKYVVVASCVEGWIPTLDRRLQGAPADRDLEEQRRLFYVALTRTKETLVISSFLGMPVQTAHQMQVSFSGQSGGRAKCLASRFLGELGPSAPRPRAVRPSIKIAVPIVQPRAEPESV
jgi:DNA helicase II / ATP-dependent DNA helicase PcrA